jgi:hypothetical protein
MRKVTLDLFESKEAFQKFTDTAGEHCKEANQLIQHAVLDLS